MYVKSQYHLRVYGISTYINHVIVKLGPNQSCQCENWTSSSTLKMKATFFLQNISVLHKCMMGTAVAQWLRCCATNRKVAGSIPDGVIGIFH